MTPLPPRSTASAPNLIERVLNRLGLPIRPIRPFRSSGPSIPSRDRQPWGKGTGRAAYATVQRRRAANRVARRSRRINRRTR